MWHIVICHKPINVVWLSLLDDRYSNSYWQSLTDSSDTATWLQIPFKPIFISASASSKQIRVSRSLQSRECFTKTLPYFFSNVLDLIFSLKFKIEKQNTYQLVLYLSLHVLLGPGWLWSDISHMIFKAVRKYIFESSFNLEIKYLYLYLVAEWVLMKVFEIKPGQECFSRCSKSSSYEQSLCFVMFCCNLVSISLSMPHNETTLENLGKYIM